jgi:hypothetical protein
MIELLPLSTMTSEEKDALIMELGQGCLCRYAFNYQHRETARFLSLSSDSKGG